jgi:hypothetical protein
MVTNKKEDSLKTAGKQGPQESAPEPNKIRFCARIWQRAQLTGFSFQGAFRRNYGSSTAIRVALFGCKLRGDLHRPVGKRAMRSPEWRGAGFRNLLNLKTFRSQLGNPPRLARSLPGASCLLFGELPRSRGCGRPPLRGELLGRLRPTGRKP